VFTALIAGLGRAGGRRGCQVAARLDIVRSGGLAYARRRVREERDALAADPGRHVYDRIWRSAADAVGAGAVELRGGMLELRRGDEVTRVSLNVTQLDDPVTLRVALDKQLVHGMLATVGVPVPEHVEVAFPKLASARAFVRRADGPCVVKPASGTSGGDGITTGVRTDDDLRRAAVRAARAGTRLLVERQLAGDEYRFLFLDGELLDVVRRRPPRVVGDGRSTIGELLATANRRRIRARGEAGLKLITVDLDTVLSLARAGFSLGSVLPAGHTIALKGLASQAGRDESDAVPVGAVQASLVEQCRRALQVIGLRLGGVDVITTDVGRPLDGERDAIIEVNGTPGLHYHYAVAQPTPSSAVALPILSKLLSTTEVATSS
jgi:D-alanine-D-alanine ligase-like ATP-grasp enzyme